MDIPRVSVGKLEDYNMCFGCGTANQHGLQMKFYQDAEVTKSEFIPAEHHQGWPGYTHGGTLMAAIDETIGWASKYKNIYAVTARMEVKLKSMARIGEPLIISAYITNQTRRTLEVEANIKRQDDSIVAEASSILFIAQPS
ncbi:PaaI family thioesterase [Chloroflexota bacterium]